METFQVTYTSGTSEKIVPVVAVGYDVIDGGILLFYGEDGCRKCCFKDWVSVVKTNNNRPYYPDTKFTEATLRSIKNPRDGISGKT